MVDQTSIRKKQSALLNILKRLPAQLAYYGSALGAIALVNGAQIPPELSIVASGIGVNILSAMIDRIARGDDLSDVKLEHLTAYAVKKSDIETLLTKVDFYRGLRQLYLKIDFDLDELRIILLTSIDTLATRAQADEILVEIRALRDSLSRHELVKPSQVGAGGYLFLSYSRRNLAQASRIRQSLENAGHEIWQDTTAIQGGAEWIEAISSGIRDCRAVVAIVSQESIESQWVNIEFLEAQRRRKYVLPIIIDNSEIPMMMLNLNVISGFPDLETGIKKILDALEIRQAQTEGRSAANNTKPITPQAGERFYYCYISETKVEQLLSLEGSMGDSEPEAEMLKTGQGSLSALIRDHFALGGEYGKPGTLSFSKPQSQKKVTELLAALYHLQIEATNLPWIHETIEMGLPIKPGQFLFYGETTALKYDNEFIYLQSRLTDNILLKISCSLRYFSDMWRDHQLVVHSGNTLFLSGEVSPSLLGLIYILQSKNNLILGTPLFLSLPLDSPLVL